jgi:hypothetical protein
MPEQIDIAVVAKDLASGPLKAVADAFRGINSPADAAQAVLKTVANFMIDAANSTVDYASEVRKLMQLTGQSAEESSRVIQVMDDFKVKTQSLTMAQRTLAKEGLSLSIDTLADLSDEYLAMGNSADRTAWLVQKFGRSGLDMAEAMGKGGKAIREASAAVDENLILNQKAIAEAREYERQVDNLNDSWTAFTTNVGRAVIPALTKGISSTVLWAEAAKEAREQTGLTRGELEALTKKLYEQKTAEYEAKNALEETATAMDNAGMSAEDLAEAEKAAAEAAKAITAANTSLLSLMGQLSDANTTYTDKNNDLMKTHDDLQRQLDQLAAEGWGPMSEQVQDVTQKYNDNIDALNKLAVEHEKDMAKIAYNLLITKLQADGFTDAEFEIGLQAGLTAGILDKKSVDMARAMNNTANATANAVGQVNGLKAAIDRLHDKTITVYTYMVQTMAERSVNGRASGGPVMAGNTYLVGERGPEMITMGNNGYVTPNNKLRSSGGDINLNVNVSGGIIQDPQEVGRQMIPALKYALRELGVAS